MATIIQLRKLALSFPEASEEPHFEKTSFRVKKKIFASFDEKNNRVCVKLSGTDQDLFCLSNKDIIYPVPNKWGKQGWTFIEIKKVDKIIFKEILITAYCEVAPDKLSTELRNKNT